METVRNSQGKLVCCIDKANRIVEIIVKGCKTEIQFGDNGVVTIQNTTMLI